MFKNRIPEHQADPSAGAQPLEFEDRILAAIEEAVRAGKLPALSANSKRLLFLELQKKRKELGFIDGAHRRWPDSLEKRQEAARWWLVHGEEGLYDRRTGRAISNEQELHAVLYGPKKYGPKKAVRAGGSRSEIPWKREHAVETIDRTGHDETVHLLGEAFEEIVSAFYRPWSIAPDSHYEEFSAWVELIRSIVIAECRAEWLGRRLAVTSPEAAAAEFGGPPPLWFDHRPLRAEAGLEGAYAGATPARVAVWIEKAREWELEHRTKSEKTAGKTRARKPAKRAKRRTLKQPTAVLPEPAESAVTAGEKPEEPASVAVEPLKEGPEAELQTSTEETAEPGVAPVSTLVVVDDQAAESLRRPGHPRSSPNLHPEVEPYLARVGKGAPRRIIVPDFCLVAVGTRDDTYFGFWRKGDPRCPPVRAKRFERTLTLSPEEFLEKLKALGGLPSA